MCRVIWLCLFAISFVLLSASANIMSVSEIQATGKVLFRALRDSECKVKCNSKRPRIMCGSDDVSYQSRCELKRANRCEGKTVNIKKKGKCSEQDVPMTKCFQDKEEALSAVGRSNTPDIFIPECNKDGSFTEVQCHKASGYCWCVSREGKPITGTSIKDDKPKCNSKVKLADFPNNNLRAKTKKGKSKRKKCTSLEKSRFNSNLVRVFTEEYNRSVKALPSVKLKNQETLVNTLEKQVVEWKFSQYDENKDNYLQTKEINALRRLVRKFIRPRACARRFLKFCDPDNNNLIEGKEWSLCLGVDMNSSQGDTTTPALDVATTGESLDLNKLLKSPSPSSSNSGEIERPDFHSLPITLDKTWTDFSRPRPANKQKQEKQRNDCETEKLGALEQEADNPNGGIFIPSCTPDGKWKTAQCHKSTGYCWCVEEDTGRPIIGTSTHNVDPKCDFDGDRQIPGCTYTETQSFLADVLNTLVQEMSEQATLNKTDHGSVITEQEQSLHERAVRWKYASLDVNGNKNLENGEMEQLKTTLKNAQNKLTRKCDRKFEAYCDENGNKKIELDEWIDCMGIKKNINVNLPANPKRVGKNPFDKYLRDT